MIQACRSLEKGNRAFRVKIHAVDLANRQLKGSALGMDLQLVPGIDRRRQRILKAKSNAVDFRKVKQHITTIIFNNVNFLGKRLGRKENNPQGKQQCFCHDSSPNCSK